MSIDVCIGNYGYYNEGELRDAWISLPKTSEEISDFLSAHGLQDPEHEEIYISDYDGVPFGLTGLFSEFTWLEDLNMLARQMEEREGAVEKVQGALDCGIDGPESSSMYRSHSDFFLMKSGRSYLSYFLATRRISCATCSEIAATKNSLVR